MQSYMTLMYGRLGSYLHVNEGFLIFSRSGAVRLPGGLWGRRGADELHSRRNSPCAQRLMSATCPKLLTTLGFRSGRIPQHEGHERALSLETLPTHESHMSVAFRMRRRFFPKATKRYFWISFVTENHDPPHVQSSVVDGLTPAGPSAVHDPRSAGPKTVVKTG